MRGLVVEKQAGGSCEYRLERMTLKCSKYLNRSLEAA